MAKAGLEIIIAHVQRPTRLAKTEGERCPPAGEPPSPGPAPRTSSLGPAGHAASPPGSRAQLPRRAPPPSPPCGLRDPCGSRAASPPPCPAKSPPPPRQGSSG
eukprot:6035876-Pyramimonas_sp.AAC.1